jgi:hypothetical protein
MTIGPSAGAARADPARKIANAGKSTPATARVVATLRTVI